MLKLSIFLAALGAIIILLASILGSVYFPNQVKSKIKSELRLTRGTSTWNKWVEIETPIFIKFYVLNVRNPDQVNDGSEQPRLSELGPYVYRQRRQKIDPLSETCKETVKYEQRITYFFDKERSGRRNEGDLVNIVNTPFISLMKGVAEKAPEAIPLVAGRLADEKIVRKGIKVRELLFEGFDVSNYSALVPVIGPLPPEFDGFRFGLYKGRNQSTDGVYEVFTGTNDTDFFGSIKRWNGEESLKYWKTKECNKLGGTDGSIFRPFLEKSDSISIYNSDICRELRLEFKEEVEVKDIKGFRFTPPATELQGAASNEEMDCYCLRDNVTECQDGIIDLGVCRNGAPIVLSTPYFLDGYEGFGQAVGLTANRTRHETTIDLEPRTGLLLEAHKRIQINVEVRPIPNAPQLELIDRPIMFPAIWLDEEAMICDVDADDFIGRVQTPVKTVKIVMWVCIAVGIALIIVGAVIAFINRNRKSAKIV